MDQNIFLKAGGSKKSSKKQSRKQSRKSSKKSSRKLSRGGSKSCPQGQILREGYTTKTGKTVAPSCIVAQSRSGEKTSSKVKAYLAEREAMYKLAREKFPKAASKKCPKGYIMREGYKRASYKSHSKSGKKTSVKSNWTAPSCIKSVVGKSEKGEKLIVIIDKDVLGKYGYNNITVMKQTDRHRALRKAIKANKPISIYRRLIAIATLNKNKDKKLYKVLREDAAWIKTQTEYIVKSSSKKSSSNKSSSKKSSSKKSSKKTASKKTASKKTSKKSQKGGDYDELMGGAKRRGSKKVSKKVSKRPSKQVSKKASKTQKAGAKKPSKKVSKKPSKKVSKKPSKKVSKKISKKTSKRRSRR